MRSEIRRAKRQGFWYGFPMGLLVMTIVIVGAIALGFLNVNPLVFKEQQVNDSVVSFSQTGIYVCKHSGYRPPCKRFTPGRYNLNECGFNNPPDTYEVNSIKIVPDDGYNGVLWSNGSPRPFEHNLNQVDAPYDGAWQLTVKLNKTNTTIPEIPTTSC